MTQKNALILLLIIYIFFQVSAFPTELVWDEAAFLGNARDTFGSSAYTEWFRNPFTSWMTATFWLVTGESVFWARALSVLAGAASIFLTYQLAKKYTRNPIVPALLLASNQQFLFWSGTAYAEIITLALIIAGAYCYEQKKLWADIAAGVLLTASFLARFANALIIASTGFWLLIKKRWLRAIAFTLGGLPLLGLWMWHNMARHGQVFWDALEQRRVIDAYTTMQPIAPFLKILIITFLPALIILGAGIIYGKGKRPTQYGAWLLSLILFLALHLFIIRLKLPRYSLALLPFIILLTVYELPRFETKKYATGVLVVAIVLAALTGPATAFVDRQGKMLCGERTQDMVAALPADAKIIGSNNWVHYGYHNNVTAFSLYTQDLEQYTAEVHPDYIIYDTQGGLEFPLEVLEAWETTGQATRIKETQDTCGKVILWQVK